MTTTNNPGDVTGPRWAGGVSDPWAGFTGQSQADADDALITDPLIRQIGELRAALGDAEARLVEAEAVIAGALARHDSGPTHEILSAYRPVVLADRDKEVAALALDAFAAELRERYPEDVFRPLSDSDHRSVNDALAGRVERTHITRDAVSADMMRFAAEQATDYATDIRSGSEGREQ